MKTLKLLGVAVAAALVLLPGSSKAADVLVDDFTSPSLTSEVRPWGGTANWRNVGASLLGNDAWKSGIIGGTNKIRSISDSSIGVNDAYTAVVVDGSIRYNHNTSTSGGDGGGIMNSGAANPDFAFHQVSMQIVREDTDFDASAHNYLRLTAWIDNSSSTAPTPNPLKPSDSAFVVTIGEEPEPGTVFGALALNQPAPNVMGPFDPGTGDLVGLGLTTSPQTFIVPIKDTDIFKADPYLADFTAQVWNTNLGSPTLTSPTLELSDWTNVRTLSFAYLVKGAAAQTGSYRASFAVDDILFYENFPATVYSADPLTFDEGASGMVDINLTAMPTDDVTLEFADTAQFTYSPNQLTFTAGNYDTPQQLTVTSITSGTVTGTQSFMVDPTVTTTDLWYGSSGVDSLNISLIEVSTVTDWSVLGE